jgi:hypothetical protein
MEKAKRFLLLRVLIAKTSRLKCTRAAAMKYGSVALTNGI